MQDDLAVPDRQVELDKLIQEASQGYLNSGMYNGIIIWYILMQ